SVCHSDDIIFLVHTFFFTVFLFLYFFFFNHPSTSVIYTLSLHDALPIYLDPLQVGGVLIGHGIAEFAVEQLLAVELGGVGDAIRSEEHTSELQSLRHLVCRLLLEKKKKKKKIYTKCTTDNIGH